MWNLGTESRARGPAGRNWRIAAGLWLGGLCLAAGASAETPGETPGKKTPGKTWALLIGVERYHHVTPLRHTVRDVRMLSHTLRERCGVPAERIREIVDTAPNPRGQPLRSSMLAAIPDWLARVAAGDQVLVYFSGHGVRSAEGRLFLAPIDCQPERLEQTAIEAEWLRQQLSACPAGFKLLILDACHAGSEKSDDAADPVTPDQLGEVFRNAENVVTLASSTANQKSQIWEEKEQSLFSFWLNQGLKGHADRDGDAVVTFDELHQYVYRTVTHSAEQRFPRPQTPVRIVRSGTVGVPAVVRLTPQPLDRVLDDMAEQLAWLLEERRLSKVGVLEFVNDTQFGELLGADFGTLGRWSAQELERRLMDHGAGKFSVVGRRRLAEALGAQAFSIDHLGSGAALARLSQGVGGMPAIAVGTLRSRAGRVVTLQCELILTSGDESGGSVSGVAVLNESEWAMLGKSVAVRAEDRRPVYTQPGETPRPQADQVIARLDQRAEAGHAHLDPAFPFRVKIRANGRELEPLYRGNDMFVGLNKGDTYEILIHNQSGEVALMRLLVDGLNTLPEDEPLKGVQASETGRPIANLSDARHWILDPRDSQVFAVRGFLSKVGERAQRHNFVVVDSQDSLAARKNFTEQIGLITAAFYAPQASTRRVGTGLGEEQDDKVATRSGFEIGNLLGVVHIRYVEQRTLDQLPTPTP